jgi:molybdopterin synthase sulfur carrier subunit
MHMKVNFYATLRLMAGAKTIDFSVNDGVTAQELLDAILDRFPAMRKELLDENGHLFGHVHFFINGRDVQFLEGNMDRRITPEDVINVFPAVGGG